MGSGIDGREVDVGQHGVVQVVGQCLRSYMGDHFDDLAVVDTGGTRSGDLFDGQVATAFGDLAGEGGYGV
ncbi:hypothetical protein D3C79_971330 [compost metagenome]